MPGVKFYLALTRHWGNMVLGSSYWHGAHGLGKSFIPGEIADYYRDYSTKANWIGVKDDQGLPLVQEPGGNLFYHPLIIAQKALGHWSCWLASGKRSENDYTAFLTIAQWLATIQELQGGWTVPSMKKSVYLSPYSALAQGQALSVLVRAYSVTNDGSYLKAARAGLEFMRKPVEQGGTSRYSSEGLILEEYPQRPPNTVLNGWVSALFGLYDMALVEKRQEVEHALQSTVGALIAYLPRYNANFWSYYDTSGTLASPYYHHVHIVQLMALEKTFPANADVFRTFRLEFEKQNDSSICTARAFLVKALQKLKKPPTTVLIQPKDNNPKTFDLSSPKKCEE